MRQTSFIDSLNQTSAAVLQSRWFQCSWRSVLVWLSKHIAVKNLFPFNHLALKPSPPFLANTRFLILCDNVDVEYVVVHQSSRGIDLISFINYIKVRMFLYSAVSSPLDRSNRFQLFLSWQNCSSRHQPGFSRKHSSQAAIVFYNSPCCIIFRTKFFYFFYIKLH